MSEGRFNINWPWNWLSELRTGRPFTVLESVQPIVDIGSHDSLILGYRETFVMAAGLNTVVLPGFNRPSELNATFPPLINGLGARRWLGLTYQSNTTTATGENTIFAYSGVGANWTFGFLEGGTIYPANFPWMVLGGLILRSGVRNALHGSTMQLYVPDPNFVFFTVPNMAGGEIITVSGLFLESARRDQQLPRMF